MLTLQTNGWKYWPHFWAIQPNATAKGRRAFQPSQHGGTPWDDADSSGTPSSMGVALPLGNPININSSSALPTAAEKRPFNHISLNSDSDPDDNGALASTLIGSSSPKSKDIAISLVPRKAHKTSISSTVHSSSAVSHNSTGAKQSPSYTLLSGQSLTSFSLTKNVKAQTVKDLGNALATMKVSLLVTPEELSSKLRCEATAIVMKDSYLSFKKQMHVAMLI